MVPVSTLPVAMRPTPLTVRTPWIGSLSGFLMGLFGALRASRAAQSVGPSYQGRFADFS